MISGSAVETTVLERIATNMPSSRPDMASSTSRWLIAGGSARVAVGVVGLVVVMARLPSVRGLNT